MPCASQYAGWQRPPANARLTRTDTYVAEGGRADLVWPEDAPRLARLQSALRIGKREPPQIVQGDLRRDLPSSIEQAPADATVVVYHSAVLNYIAEPAQRHEFARSMQASRCVWVSNESSLVFPQFLPADVQQPSGMFLLCIDGHALAWTDPHGGALQWLRSSDFFTDQRRNRHEEMRKAALGRHQNCSLTPFFNRFV